MPEICQDIHFAAKSVRLFWNPFPHAIIDPFLPSSLFDTLAASWPSTALHPVPAERTLANPRRRHVWLNELCRMQGINSSWFETASLFGSDEFREGLLDLLNKCGQTATRHVTCISRLCEEELPYHLETHRDQPEKILSLVWYIDGGPGSDLGTVLYGKNESKSVRSKENSALFLPNTENSYHGGTWSKPERFLRRTVQVFVIDASSSEPATTMLSRRG